MSWVNARDWFFWWNAPRNWISRMIFYRICPEYPSGQTSRVFLFNLLGYHWPVKRSIKQFIDVTLLISFKILRFAYLKTLCERITLRWQNGPDHNTILLDIGRDGSQRILLWRCSSLLFLSYWPRNKFKENKWIIKQLTLPTYLIQPSESGPHK